MKYRKGSNITDPFSALLMIAKGETVYLNGRVQTPGFLKNLSVNTIMMKARGGLIAFAHKSGED